MNMGAVTTLMQKELRGHPSVVNLSPAAGMTGVSRVAGFILSGNFPCRVRLNMQIHKILNLA